MCSLKNSFHFPFDIEALDTIETVDALVSLRDTQTIGDGDKTVDFFPRDVQASEVLANYGGNPLSGSYAHTIIGMRVDPTVLVIRSQDLAAVDPGAILNALQNALIKVTGDNGTVVLHREPLRKFMDLSDVEFNHSANAAGTADYFWVTLKASEDYVPVSRAFVIAANQDFGVSVQFEAGDGAAFGAAADYDLGQPGLSVDLLAAIENGNG